MTTRWRPDTCQCILEYDDTNTPSAIINKCQKHTNLATPAALNLSLKNHNTAKNNVLNWMITNNVSLGVPMDTAENYPQAKVGYNFSGASAVEPVLVVVPSYNAAQVASLQSAADTQFGLNKVVVSSS